MGGKMDLKYLCVFDMDGTLLDSNHEVPKENMHALNELKNMGIGVALATGRTELMTRKYVSELGISLPIISNNGALVVDVKTRKVIHGSTFSKNNLSIIVDYTIRNNCDYFIYTIDKVFYSPNSERIKIMNYYNSLVPVEERIETIMLPDSLTEVFEMLPLNGNDSVFKVLLSYQTIADEKYFSSQSTIESVSSQTDALDLMPLGSTKGSSVMFLADYLNVNPQNIFAFGDNYNDISMLEYAGYAISPSNAVSAIKAIADYVTTSNDESGIAKAIYEFVLPVILKNQSREEDNKIVQ